MARMIPALGAYQAGPRACGNRRVRVRCRRTTAPTVEAPPCGDTSARTRSAAREPALRGLELHDALLLLLLHVPDRLAPGETAAIEIHARNVGESRWTKELSSRALTWWSFRMLEEGIEWFGETVHVKIVVEKR